MGVISSISLKELNQLFCEYSFTKIEPTSNGTIDTTYIVSTKTKSYILKKYERDIPQKIKADTKLLGTLNESGLNVPLLLLTYDGWYLYKKLDGHSPKWVQPYHIVTLARFISKLHLETKKMKSSSDFIESYDLKSMLNYTKKHHYSYFKKLQILTSYKTKNEGFIHGDMFKDNTVFDGSKIGVFDFIDSGNGEFLFDIAVALSAFNPSKRQLYLNLFIKTYNQHAPKKIEKKALMKMLKVASSFYALLRIDMYKNTAKARELL